MSVEQDVELGALTVHDSAISPRTHFCVSSRLVVASAPAIQKK